jgi:hypothetical protein
VTVLEYKGTRDIDRLTIAKICTSFVVQIHNFMTNYGDSCRNEFTRGQIERMYYVWSIYRKDSESCTTGDKLFEFEILADSWPEENHWTLTSSDGKFQWDTLKQNSDISFDFTANASSTQGICIDSTKNYTFTIYDDGNNGIQNSGYYIIRYDGVELKRNRAFGGSDVTNFPGGSKPPAIWCFSGKNLVDVQSKGLVRLSDPAIGTTFSFLEGSMKKCTRSVIATLQHLPSFYRFFGRYRPAYRDFFGSFNLVAQRTLGSGRNCPGWRLVDQGRRGSSRCHSSAICHAQGHLRSIYQIWNYRGQ